MRGREGGREGEREGKFLWPSTNTTVDSADPNEKKI